jgi:hypothetical protein
LIWYAVAGLLWSRAALQTEVLALRHQLNVLTRRAPKRVAVSNIDRLVFAGLYHLAPEVLDAVKIVKTETIIRWHRAGFRAWWRWKSRPRGGRPGTPDEIRQLIREMSVANPLWVAPRTHGELRKLGMDVGFSSCDSPAASFCGLGVTAHPNADWLARQLRTCRWDEPPRYVIRDRDGAYGAAFIRRIRAMGTHDRPVSARRLGRTDMRRGWSARSDGNVLITSSPLASAIFVLALYQNTTKRSERTYRCRRTRRFGVMCAAQGARVRRRSWAGYTINMFEFEFPTGLGPRTNAHMMVTRRFDSPRTGSHLGRGKYRRNDTYE